ncbi:isocitrate lyase/PEP mutase family protein [Rhizocola hellebori]|uniref:isocitrate lyase/PEP mutase family protein n=1 Tax=Rhizocola hellebori TaxID=1392758 RepID=UPI001943115D|nr:isocitrate lyase/phosphoenolpyruvate mutase family protein [Rhizocola hellebori]
MSFAELHRRGEPLVLPNAWDHASAALFAQHFPAIGTTSLGVAAAHGVPDGGGLTPTLDLVRRIAHLPCMISVDIETGPVALIPYLAQLGVVGVNIEDELGPIGPVADKITAIKTMAPGIFVNARTDTHWLGADQQSTIPRLRAYLDAGADGIFVPGLTSRSAISELIDTFDAPLNVLYTPQGPTLPELAALGVARVSMGSALFRAALQAALDQILSISGRPGAQMLNYARIQSLALGQFMAE